MPAHSLPKRERLERPAEYKRAAKEGYSYRSSSLILRTLRNNLTFNRLGIVVPRAAAKTSAERNYIRRIIKEAYRTTKPHKRSGFDAVAISLKPRPAYEDIKNDMAALLEKAGIL